MAIIPIGCAPQNFRKGRPSHLQVEAVVIHIIDGTQRVADALFLDPNLKDRRSAHYSVGKEGEVHQYVDEADTAYHCGVVVNPTWSGLKKGPDGKIVNPNFYTIGIEHEGRADDDWSEAMYEASAALLRDIAQRYPALQPMTSSNVVMHRQIRASKTCPGFKADLSRLIAAAGNPAGGGLPPNAPRSLRTRTFVNVRSGQPSRRAPSVRIIPPGEIINVRGFVTGELVDGVSRWYQNVDDDFIWACSVEE